MSHGAWWPWPHWPHAWPRHPATALGLGATVSGCSFKLDGDMGSTSKECVWVALTSRNWPRAQETCPFHWLLCLAPPRCLPCATGESSKSLVIVEWPMHRQVLNSLWARAVGMWVLLQPPGAMGQGWVSGPQPWLSLGMVSPLAPLWLRALAPRHVPTSVSGVVGHLGGPCAFSQPEPEGTGSAYLPYTETAGDSMEHFAIGTAA